MKLKQICQVCTVIGQNPAGLKEVWYPGAERVSVLSILVWLGSWEQWLGAEGIQLLALLAPEASLCPC